MLMNDKIMFDRYYCINSTKHCENEENIGALYFSKQYNCNQTYILLSLVRCFLYRRVAYLMNTNSPVLI